MGFLYGALIFLHVVLCIILVLLVLLQSDKGGGLAGAFGGMGGGAAFSGTSTATFLTKLTSGVALFLFLLILSLNYLSDRRGQQSQKISEMQRASKGMSSALPVNPGSPAIPGLGPTTNPAAESQE